MFPTEPGAQTAVFCAGNSTTGFQAWAKPPEANFVAIFAINPGGGGGGGRGAATGLSCGGGGGGASGAVMACIYPAWVLPNVLFVKVNCGSAGGAGGTNADGSAAPTVSTNAATVVNVHPVIATAQNYLANGGAPGSAATGGTTGGGGTGGANDTPTAETGAPLCRWSILRTSAGNAGNNGAANFAATSADFTSPRVSGGGGAGLDAAGVAYAGGSAVNTISGTPFVASGPLGSGFAYNPAAVFAGGGGGSGNAAGTGDRGGNGVMPGCGGGGGGGGLTTGGHGGDGGPGLVVIQWW